MNIVWVWCGVGPCVVLQAGICRSSLGRVEGVCEGWGWMTLVSAMIRGATFTRLPRSDPEPNRIRPRIDPDPINLDRVWFKKYNRLNYGYGYKINNLISDPDPNRNRYCNG